MRQRRGRRARHRAARRAATHAAALQEPAARLDPFGVVAQLLEAAATESLGDARGQLGPQPEGDGDDWIG